MTRIVVLGGLGFMGKEVCRQLDEVKLEHVAWSRRTGCNLLEYDSVVRHLEEFRPEVIINCAAHVGSVQYAIQHAGEMLYDNMGIIGNLYKAVAHHCPTAKIINPISNCSYPGDANIHSEPDYWMGKVHDSVAAYGNPRRMIIIYAECFKWQYGVSSVNWLVANAYGPGDYLDPNKVHALNGIIIRLIRAKRAGETSFEIWGTGTPIREWLYVKDAARIMVESINLGEQIVPVNVAQNTGYSINEIASISARHLEYPVTFTNNTKFADGAPIKILDDKLFRKMRPEFSFTPLEEGIRETIQYYEANL